MSEGGTASTESFWSSFWARHSTYVWMCTGYVVVAVGLSIVLLSDYVFNDLLQGLRLGVASGAASAMSALGFPITSSGELIHGPGNALMIVNECTGVDATILLVAAVLVFPARLGQKLGGLVLAISVMMIVNFVRVLTLVYLGNYHAELLETGHLYVWPVIVILVGVGTLLLWADRVVDSGT